jgi:cytoskeletal protein CcmA (bactofilin family)
MLGKDKKGSSTDSATISTLLGRDTVIEGTLTFKETIRIDGHISGKLISPEGTVIVGENAVLDADIQVGVAVIRGKINGRVEASKRIEIYAPAQVNGDIHAPTLSIDSGVFFNGNCKMQTPPAKPIKGYDKAEKEPPIKEAPNPKAVKNL